MIIWFFLSIVALIWLIFGSIQDLKQKEVANWITLSLVGIGLSARLFFSIESGNWNFLHMGIFSVLLMYIISLGLYYGKVFAGGDTKLIRGLAAFIPGNDFSQVTINVFACVILLLLIGSIYSLLFSIILAIKNKNQFKKEFGKRTNQYYFILPAVLLLVFFAFKENDLMVSALISIISFSMLAYPYFLSVDKCMTKLYSPGKLTAGDWLLENVKVGNKTIRATVHGLSERDIAILIKARKKVLIKEGIPFVPVFLLTYVFMVFFFLLGQNLLTGLL